MTAYTDSLRLTLPVTGTDDGTWGETVNDGITSLVDASIAGTATVAHDNTANYTLTDNDGATDEARQMFLNITGALTAARNVVCPGVSKLYFLTNNTTGGYAVTLKTSGGTGISVANGKSAALYCNGTNVVYAFDQVTLKPTVTISGNMDNGTTDYAVSATPAVQSNVTSNANIFSTAPTTEADTFTLTALRHYQATQGTFGAGSTVTSQYGFAVNSTLTDAQFNYGFYNSMSGTAGVAITSISGTGSTATVESAASHGLADGDLVFINGTSVAGYTGGPYTVTVVDSNTFTYPSTETAASTGGYSTKANNYSIYTAGAPVRFGGPTTIAANSYMDALRITQTSTGNALLIEDSSNPDPSPFLVDASGVLVTGYTAPVLNTGSVIPPRIQTHSSGSNSASISLTSWLTGVGVGPSLFLSRSEGGVAGTQVIVDSGDQIGALRFTASDGTNFIEGARIESAVDGTPGTNDMPGRLVFSTTADGASSPTERMRIDSAGKVGIGSTSFTNYGLRVGSAITGGTSAFGIGVSGAVQSDVTSYAYYVRVDTSTQAAAFTAANITGFEARQGTFGAGSTVTNQYGFAVTSSLTGATNNYGFHSSIASGTGRYNFYAAGTAENYFGGNTTISVTDNTNAALRITQLGTGNALLVEDSANPDSTPFVIDAAGNVIKGATATFTSASALIAGIQAQSTGVSASSLGLYSFNTTAVNAPRIDIGRTRGAVGAYDIVQNNDQLGVLRFTGGDGTQMLSAAEILAQVDGTPGTNDMPGRLVFSTTADGALAPTERMRIDSAGNVGIGAASLTGYSILSQKNITGATTSYGMVNGGTTQSDVTASAVYYSTSAKTQATAFTLTSIQHYAASQGTIGAGSTVTNQYGFIANSTLTGATNNYGFYGNITAGTGRYNFYAAGTAENYFGGNTTISVTDNTNAALRITQLGTGNALLVEDSSNPDSTPFVIDASGNVIAGNTSSVSGTVTALVQVQSTGTNAANSIQSYSTTNPPTIEFDRSRGALGAHTVVASGDVLGRIFFDGSDGAAFIRGAQILAEVDGTPGTNDMPGRLTFSTTADGESSPTERMRIDSSGNVGIGNTAPACALDVTGGIQTSRTAVTSPASTDGNVFSGTYTPTLTNVTNVGASTAYSCQYMRVGNVVTVSGRVGIDATAAGSIEMQMSLPIASTLGTSGRAAGTFASYTIGVSDRGSVSSVSSTSKAVFRGVFASTAGNEFVFTFTYLVA